jgi:hypothetical protein
MSFSIGFFKKNSNTAPNNGTNDAVSLPSSPKIGYRANKAIKSAMDRRDSFTMNEFGDVAGNNFAEVKLKHFEDKAVLADQPKRRPLRMMWRRFLLASRLMSPGSRMVREQRRSR